MATWDGTTLTAYVSTQSVHDVRDGLADALGLPVNRVRVICEHMGGGFGAKQIVWKPTVLAAVLAMRTGRPVRLMLDRHGEALATGHRNPTHADGPPQRRRRRATWSRSTPRSLIGAGAYTVGGESSVVEGPYQYLYDCENVRTVKTVVRTHHGPSVAFRAPGYVEGAFALESAMDELADQRSASTRSSSVAATRPSVDQVDDRPLSSPDAPRHLLRLRCRHVRLGRTRSRRTPSRSNGCRVGFDAVAASLPTIGSAASHTLPPTPACVVEPDGSVQVVTGTQDIGTGTRTVLAQVAADSLGMAEDRVVVSLGDTAHGLHAPVSSGSATVPTMGPAVHHAACDARRQLLAAAAKHLETSVDDVEWDGNAFRDSGRIDHDVARPAGSHRAATHHRQRRLRGSSRTTCRSARSAPSAPRSTSTCDTGAVTVGRVVYAPDCGRVVNPLLARSQVIGGVTQGLGFTLTEHEVSIICSVCRSTPTSRTISCRRSPTAARSVHAVVDLPDFAANPLGAKGLGELPMIAVAPAIANAVFDATGLRIRELPITRRRILDALAAREPAMRSFDYQRPATVAADDLRRARRHASRLRRRHRPAAARQAPVSKHPTA